MVDPLTAGKAIVTVGKLALAVKEKLEAIGPTAKIREAMDVDARAWRAMRDAQIDRRLTQLEAGAGEDAGFAERIEAMLGDHQFTRLHRNLEFEAAREATHERRRMLAHLAAGLSDPNLSINEKARIERTARGLDPADVFALREMALDTTVSLGLRKGRPSAYAALVASGCVLYFAPTVGGDTAVVSGLGFDLLRALETFTPGGDE